MKKFDILFTKSKLLKKTIETWIEAMCVVRDTDDVLEDKEREYIKKNISKFMHKDIKAIGSALKQTKKKRKTWAKAGAINSNEEFIEFMYDIGLPIPEVIQEEDAKPEETTGETNESEEITVEKEVATEEVETNTQEENSETEPKIEQKTPEEQAKEDTPEEKKENTSEKAQELPKNSDVQGG